VYCVCNVIYFHVRSKLDFFYKNCVLNVKNHICSNSVKTWFLCSPKAKHIVAALSVRLSAFFVRAITLKQQKKLCRYSILMRDYTIFNNKSYLLGKVVYISGTQCMRNFHWLNINWYYNNNCIYLHKKTTSE
jgi:hypothetical protein